jgi:hypothetical protein
MTSKPDHAGTKSTKKRCDTSITVFQHGYLISVLAAIFEGGREGASSRRIESLTRVAVCHRFKGDDYDKRLQDHDSASLQALIIGGRDMRKRRSHDARCEPACSGSQNLTKCRQVPGIAEGRADVQQLQAFHGSERVPDG